MCPLRRFWHIAPADRRLLIWAAWTLGLVRLGLWLLPFGRLRRLLDRPVRPSCQVPADKITWAVSAASRYMPAATCLNQALATRVLLAQSGHSATLRIGVARSGTHLLQAHAWVESDGRIVLGDLPDLAHYTPLPPLEGGGA